MMPRPLLFRYVLKQFSVRIKTGNGLCLKRLISRLNCGVCSILIIKHRMEERFKGRGVDASCADAVSCVFARFGGDFVMGTERGEYRDVHTVLYTDA